MPKSARCPSGQRAHQPLENGIQIARKLRYNDLQGLSGRLDRLADVVSNFKLRINLLGYTGGIVDVKMEEGSTRKSSN